MIFVRTFAFCTVFYRSYVMQIPSDFLYCLVNFIEELSVVVKEQFGVQQAVLYFNCGSGAIVSSGAFMHGVGLHLEGLILSEG